MGIVDDGRKALGRTDGLESSVDGNEFRHLDEQVMTRNACSKFPDILVLQNLAGCAIDGDEVGGIEASHEIGLHLLSVNEERHAFERFFDNPGGIVGHGAHTVTAMTSLGVLQHHLTVAVVEVGDSKSLFLQAIEELLFGMQIVLERLMVVQVVACQIGEDAAIEVQAADALLIDGVARHLHENEGATGIDHLLEQVVEFLGIGSGEGSVDRAVDHVVAYGRNQSAGISELGEELVEKGGDGGLAVGASHTDEGQLFRRIAVPGSGKKSTCQITIFDNDESRCIFERSRQLATLFVPPWFVAHYGYSPALDGLGNERVPIDGSTMYGNEECAWGDYAVVGHDGADLDIFCSGAFKLVGEALQKLTEFHFGNNIDLLFQCYADGLSLCK